MRAPGASARHSVTPSSRSISIFAIAIGASACSHGEGAASGSAPRDGAAVRVPWATSLVPAPPSPPDNPTTPEKIALGRTLFHDPLLSADRKVACVTCHSQYWGMADGLAQSIGVGGKGPTGTGRTGPTHTRRNALTLWNAAYRPRLFWDGRAATLEDQVLVPLADPLELGRAPADVVADLRAIPAYVALFRAAFPGDIAPVRVESLQKSIAAFVRTIVSVNAPYDRYARGDELAISDEERRGMLAFAALGCDRCHSPPLFESDRYAAVDRAPGGVGEPGVADMGRFEVTGRAADRNAFRAPTLRNLRTTGPYFHDGSVPTIDAAVARMSVPPFARRTATAEEIALVSEFLRTSLADQTREPERLLEVPSGLPVPLDGFRIPR